MSELPYVERMRELEKEIEQTRGLLNTAITQLWAAAMFKGYKEIGPLEEPLTKKIIAISRDFLREGSPVTLEEEIVLDGGPMEVPEEETVREKAGERIFDWAGWPKEEEDFDFVLSFPDTWFGNPELSEGSTFVAGKEVPCLHKLIYERGKAADFADALHLGYTNFLSAEEHRDACMPWVIDWQMATASPTRRIEALLRIIKEG